MRLPRPSIAVLLLPAALLGATACTTEGGPASAGPAPTAATSTAATSSGAMSSAASPSTAAGSSSAPPTPAGSAEASAVALLPAGPATGTAVLGYSGVGEVREPFTGECAHDGGTTRIEGSADTARLRLEVAPDGARLALEDVGFSASSTLTTGRYDVEGGHLSLSAGLTRDGQTVGSVQLEVDCGR